MSALVKPMIHSSRATGDVQPVNAEKIINFVKLTIPPTPNSVKTVYRIVFSMDAGMNVKQVTWEYATSILMDNDFTAIVGLVSTVTP